MKQKKVRLNISFIFFMLLFIITCSKKQIGDTVIIPPKAEKIPKELTMHDHARVDNYYWLNERENPKVIEHLKAENAYRDAVMKPTEKLQKKLYNEIIGRIKQDDESVPYLKNGYYYYRRYEKGEEYPVYYRKKGSSDAADEILLNVPEMAKYYDYYRATGLNVSENNQFLAFGVDTVSRRRYTIYFKDLLTGEILQDKIENTTGAAVWANDNKTVFYTTKDNTLRSNKVWKHILGTKASEDVEVYEEKDNTFSVYVDKSKSGKYIIVGSYHTLSTEMRLIDADHPEKDVVLFHAREKDNEYHIFHHSDKFYILTNKKAKNFRLMKTSLKKTSAAYWKEVIPHRKDVLLENVNVFKDFLVLGERKDGIRQIRVINLNDQSDHYLKFDEDAYVTYPTNNYLFDTKVLRYNYTSMTTPMSTFDYDMVSNDKTLLKVEEIGGKFNQKDYQSERVWALSRDGVKVPMTLVYRKDLVKDGNNPLLLYSYGSYGYSTDPYFNSARLSLLDRGFVYALAHVRGGSEMGRDWYENGKLLKKKNTFNDFVDCAEFLIAEKYTCSEKLFASGGSAGGLLMGAIVNMKPELFKGVIAAVPWVDVVTTMLDESIPLTTSEYDEWGNPNNKLYYDYMLSYSPYDNVTAQNYPMMLVTTGLHDSQVQYFEPTKWVAKLREMKTDDNLIILDVDMGSGHGGASGRFKRHKRTAKEYAFMLNLLGM